MSQLRNWEWRGDVDWICELAVSFPLLQFVLLCVSRVSTESNTWAKAPTSTAPSWTWPRKCCARPRLPRPSASLWSSQTVTWLETRVGASRWRQRGHATRASGYLPWQHPRTSTRWGWGRSLTLRGWSTGGTSWRWTWVSSHPKSRPKPSTASSRRW